MRSSVVPHTMASDTAQKTNWKNHFDSTVALDRPMIGKAFCGSPKLTRKKPSWPMMCPSGPPKAKAKPTAQYKIPAIEKFVRIFATTVPAFLPREKPISRKANPACMNMTRQPAKITQTELMATDWSRPWLPARSKVWAKAAVGAASAGRAPRARARASVDNLNLIRPPGQVAPRRIGADGPPIISPVSKDPPRSFRHLVERPCPRVRNRLSQVCPQG